MSRQPAAKTSHQPNKEQELYEHVEMQEQQSHYMTINRPNPVEVEDKSQLAGQISTKVKRGKRVVIALIAVFLVCALVVSLVAVIMYSPLVSSGDNTESSASTAGDNMLSRISQLEGSIASMQNLLQTSTSIQNNVRQDLDRLRTINLYEGCIQETRTCTIPTSSTSTYATCLTSSVTINP
ncbi:uncharacterized protein LOC135348196 isoform X6 [Halichondria panicea]|uniref:uncharacterized protein LOC135348196 isoform X6 n=1 Tax=Halichondria panicea TaxID=6063 RepID=UPI00312B37B8